MATFARILINAMKKVALALTNDKRIVISRGDEVFEKKMLKCPIVTIEEKGRENFVSAGKE